MTPANVQVDALKAAEALRRREAAKVAERQEQKRKLKADRARHAQQVKVSLATRGLSSLRPA